jgi:hypothetical protein
MADGEDLGDQYVCPCVGRCRRILVRQGLLSEEMDSRPIPPAATAAGKGDAQFEARARVGMWRLVIFLFLHIVTLSSVGPVTAFRAHFNP